MSGFSDKDRMTDFTRRVKKLMEEVVAESGERFEWEILPVSQANPHARVVIEEAKATGWTI